MAETDEIKNVNAADDRFPEESVDDILAGILNRDGSFNDEFGSMLNKYLGENAAHISSLRGMDLSDRTDEPYTRQRIEYEAPEARYGVPADPDMRIGERMPENMRGMYSDAAYEAQRPEFMPNGGVRYPMMGVGASEERVVYDAEWEERARQEAARLQRVREDRMLRGDSTYVRSFVAGGRSMDGRGRAASNSPYIDPLSADDDLDDDFDDWQTARNDKRSFFQEGPPAARVRSNASAERGGNVGGRTESERSYNGRKRFYNGEYDRYDDPYADERHTSGASWMQVEKDAGEKKQKHGRRDKHVRTVENGGGSKSTDEAVLDAPVRRNGRGSSGLSDKKDEAEISHRYEMDRSEQTTEGLRSAVAEIVDKYTKRSEAEAEAQEKARRDELAKKRRIREERESFFKNLSADVVAAMKEDAKGGDDDPYEDFSSIADGQGSGSSGGAPGDDDFSCYLEET